MAKDILAFFGLVFLTLLIFIGVGLVGFFYDSVGIVELPAIIPTTLAELINTREVTVVDLDLDRVEWSNPLDGLPSPTWQPSPTERPTSTPLPPPTSTPWPTATITPVPTLDPLIYRTEAILRLKDFVATLERWLDANQQLGMNNALLNDPSWRSEMEQINQQVAGTARALAVLGPVPSEYRGIQSLLVEIHRTADQLRAHHDEALRSGDSARFRQAGDDFNRIKAYLAEAVQEMVAHGWVLE